jgi:heme-degrading monooxygenase HmoA
MIARTWRGWTAADDMQNYSDYLEETGLKEYRATPGNRGAFAFRRLVDGRAEFLLLTLWEDEASMRAFAGDNPEVAVFYPEDDKFLVDRETTTDHFEVFFSDQAS